MTCRLFRLEWTEAKNQRQCQLVDKEIDGTISVLDRSPGKHTIANALRQAGIDVQIHDDHFSQDVTDEHWLHQVGQRGWVVLTRDKWIRRRSHERAALMQAGVRAFVLVAGNFQVVRWLRYSSKPCQPCADIWAQHPPPFIARVTRSGAVSIIAAYRRLMELTLV